MPIATQTLQEAELQGGAGLGVGGWGVGVGVEKAGKEKEQERERDLSFFTLSFLKASSFPCPLSSKIQQQQAQTGSTWRGKRSWTLLQVFSFLTSWVCHTL